MKIYVILLTEYYDGGMYPEDSYERTSIEGHAFYSEEAAKAYCEKENAEYAKPASKFNRGAAKAEYRELFPDGSDDDEEQYVYDMECAHYAFHNDEHVTYEASYEEVELN